MKQSALIFFLCGLLCFPALAQDSKENADFKLAVNLYNDKLYDLALEQFQSFINLYPNTAQGIEARFYLGLTQSKLDKHDEARFTFQNFALTYPDNIKSPEAWMNAAGEYAAMKNDREAAMAFERVKTFYPKSKFASGALLKSAEYYKKIGEKENALRVLRMLTQDYTSAEVLPARLKLAEMLVADGQYEQARIECKRVVDAASDASLKARAYVLMAQSLVGLGKSTEAEAAVSQVTKNFKSTISYYEALFTLGMLKNLTGKTEDATIAWQKLADDTAKAPKQLRQDAYIELAEMNKHTGSFSKALVCFESASRIRGMRNGEALYEAGVAAERTGDLIKAALFYSRALNDSIGHVDRRALIIGAYKAAKITKNYAEAVRLIQQYRRQFSTDTNLPRLLFEGASIANKELGDPKTAIDFCGWLLEHFPESEYVDDAAFVLGEALEKSGDTDAAIAAFENMQRRYPSSEFIEAAQERIRFIKAFRVRHADESLQKLALLVGDVIEQKTKGNLAYRLAEIYFSDLKDYQLAAQQYAYALSVDLEDALRPAAWFKQAQSFELLALKEREQRSTSKEFLSKAIALYDSLVAVYPAGELSDQAVIKAFTLRLQLAEKEEDLRALGTEFLTKSSGARGRDVALLLLGDSYLRAKNFENAVLTYKLLLEKYPDSETIPSAKYRVGIALDGMMEKDSAKQVLEQFLSENPNNSNSAAAAAYLAKAEADSGQLMKALSYYDLLEKRYFYSPINSNLDVRKADAYFLVNDFNNALEWYKRAWERLQAEFFIVNADPEEEHLIIFRLAVCNEKLGNPLAAKKWYTEYVTRDQSSERAGKAYYALAYIAKAENNINLATRYLEDVSSIAAKTGGKSVSVTLETADMLFRDDKYSDAIVKYNEVVSHTNNDTTKQYAQSRIVVSYFRLDNVKEADKRAADFLKAHEDADNNAAEFEFERGKYQIRKEDLAKANERFNSIVRLYPKAPIIPEVFYWKARVYELDQKLPQAVNVYDSLLRYYPNSEIIPRVRLGLGNVYYTLEQWDAASKQYRALLDDEQRSPELVPMAMSNLIMTYKEMGMFDAALELVRKYIDRFPDDPDVIDKKIDIGVLYQKLGYFDQSILHLQGLIEAGNTDLEAELRYYIGEAYFYKGEYQQAILEFLKVPYLVTRRGKADWISASYYMAGQSYEKMSKYDEAMTMYKQIIDRKDTDSQFKIAAKKEIDRVRIILGKK